MSEYGFEYESTRGGLGAQHMVGLRREYAGRGPLLSSSSHYIVPPWLAGLGCCSPTTTLVPALSPPGSTPHLLLPDPLRLPNPLSVARPCHPPASIQYSLDGGLVRPRGLADTTSPLFPETRGGE